MKYIIAILILLLCSTVSADVIISHDVTHDNIMAIPYQSKGNTELYSKYFGLLLYEELMLRHEWEEQDEVFLYPVNPQGISEIYTLGWYLDQDKSIPDVLWANNYRIEYKFSDEVEDEPEHFLGDVGVLSEVGTSHVVPEPMSFITLLIGFPFLLKRNRS
jgi:hypothetical protein